MDTLNHIVETLDMRRMLIAAIPAGLIAGRVTVFLIDHFQIDVWAALITVSLLSTVIAMSIVYFLFRDKRKS